MNPSLYFLLSVILFVSLFSNGCVRIIDPGYDYELRIENYSSKAITFRYSEPGDSVETETIVGPGRLAIIYNSPAKGNVTDFSGCCTCEPYQFDTARLATNGEAIQKLPHIKTEWRHIKDRGENQPGS